MSEILESIYETSNLILDDYLRSKGVENYQDISGLDKRLEATILKYEDGSIIKEDEYYVMNLPIFRMLYRLINKPYELTLLMEKLGIKDKNMDMGIRCQYGGMLCMGMENTGFENIRKIMDRLRGESKDNTLESIYETADEIVETYLVLYNIRMSNKYEKNTLNRNKDLRSRCLRHPDLRSRLMLTLIKKYNGTLNKKDEKYVDREYEFSNLYYLIDDYEKLLIVASEIGIEYRGVKSGAIDIIRDIMDKRSNDVVRDEKKGCGFLTPENPLRWNEPHMKLGKTNCDLTFELRGKFLSLLSRLEKENKDVLLLISYGDSIKNNYIGGDNFSNPHSTLFKLAKNFKSMGYEEKAEYIRNKQGIDEGDVDRGKWSRQQWPYNTIRYARDNNYHLIYIQADLAYCAWPSVYAEAMCGDLYNKSEYLENSAFHFSGENNDLFCVGEYKVAYGLKNMSKRYINVKHVPPVNGNYEWLNFSDSFNKSFHENILDKEDINEYYWLTKRWDLESSILTVINKDDKDIMNLGPIRYLFFRSVEYDGTVENPIIEVTIKGNTIRLNMKDIRNYI